MRAESKDTDSKEPIEVDDEAFEADGIKQTEALVESFAQRYQMCRGHGSMFETEELLRQQRDGSPILSPTNVTSGKKESARKSARSGGSARPVIASARLQKDAPDSPVRGRSRRLFERRIDNEKRVHISEIRTTEQQDADDELMEDAMPEMVSVRPTFSSAAHLRSDEYWADILGSDGQDRAVCTFVDSSKFKAMVGVGILANSLLFSTHEDEHTHIPKWEVYVKQGVLVFSFFELCIIAFRIRAGVAFRDSGDRLFVLIDAGAVASCLFLQWVIPCMFAVLQPSHDNLGTITRLCWLLRFLRIVRIVPALQELVRGVLQALSGLFWVFVFVFMMLYTLAVLCTAIIGHSELDKYLGRDSAPTPEAQAVKFRFSTVPSSMFLLFETMSSWSLMPLIPLFEAAPIAKLFFCAFYVFSGWTLLAVMTGTVSFTMIAIKAQIVGDDLEREFERKSHVSNVLLKIFNQLDEDGSGNLDYQEFKQIVQSTDVLRLLGNHTNIKAQDLEDLWCWVDSDGSNEVSVDEFMAAFQWLNEPFKPKTLMKLQSKVGTDVSGLRTGLECMINEKFKKILGEVRGPLRKIHAVTEQVQVLGAMLVTMRGFFEAAPDATRDDVRSPGRADLQALEQRLNAQIDEAMARLARFEVGDTFASAPMKLKAAPSSEGSKVFSLFSGK